MTRTLVALAVMVPARWAIAALSPVREKTFWPGMFTHHRAGVCLVLYELRDRVRAWADPV